jgi:hypothetical protein
MEKSLLRLEGCNDTADKRIFFYIIFLSDGFDIFVLFKKFFKGESAAYEGIIFFDQFLFPGNINIVTGDKNKMAGYF